MRVKIVHLFPRLMSLYGDYANVALLQRRLSAAGVEAEVVRAESAAGLAEYGGEHSLLFAGAGTESAAARACADCFAHRGEIEGFLEKGGKILACGTAGAALGRGIELEDGLHEGAGVAGALFVFKPGVRRYAEVLARFAGVGDAAVGSINTSCEVAVEGDEMFSVVYSSSAGVGAREGFSDGRVFWSELSGPLLVRNPALLDHFAGLLAGEELPPPEGTLFKHLQRGYASVAATLSAAARGGGGASV